MDVRETTVKVAVRVRPLSAAEIVDDAVGCINILTAENQVCIYIYYI